MKSFRSELNDLINCHSRENGSNTPDFILAQFLHQCLDAFDTAVRLRDRWYGRIQEPGGIEINSVDPESPPMPTQPLEPQRIDKSGEPDHCSDPDHEGGFSR